MDPRPRPNKQSGAYMNPGAYDVHPYLLLNLSDKYDGLTTFAHEWGHAMHTMLANSQPYELSQYPTFIAEIASTCQELLLANMMIGRAQSKEEKLFYLGQLMEQPGGEPGNRHAAGAQQRRDVRQPERAGWRDHDGGAGQQRAPDFQRGGIERDRGQVEQPLAGTEGGECRIADEPDDAVRSDRATGRRSLDWAP